MQQAADRLTAHHGTAKEPMPRRHEAAAAERKPDWHCKRCHDDRDKSKRFRNFGRNDRCFKCNVAKGACFHSEVQVATTRSPTRSLATRQVGQQREADKLAKVQAELQRCKKLLKANATESLPKTAEAAAEEADGAEHEFEHAVEKLQKHRRFMLVEMQCSAEHADVVKLDKQIAVQQEAKLSGLPASVRVKRADKKVEQAQGKVEAMVSKYAKLDEDLQKLRAKIVEHKAGIDKAREDLAEAVQQRDAIWVDLRPAVDASAKCDNSMQELAQLSDSLSEDDLKGFGVEKEHVATVINGLQKALAKKNKAVKEAEAAKREAGNVGADFGATEVAATPQVAARWAEVHDEDDDVQMDEQQIVEAMPGGIVMDAETRSAFMRAVAKSVVRPGKKVQINDKVGTEHGKAAKKPAVTSAAPY